MTTPLAAISTTCSRFALPGLVAIHSVSATAQGMEPRAYSAVPTGTNLVDLDYTRSSGDVLLTHRFLLAICTRRSILIR